MCHCVLCGCRYHPSAQEATRRHADRPALPLQPPPYRPQVFDPVGLVAGHVGSMRPHRGHGARHPARPGKAEWPCRPGGPSEGAQRAGRAPSTALPRAWVFPAPAARAPHGPRSSGQSAPRGHARAGPGDAARRWGARTLQAHGRPGGHAFGPAPNGHASRAYPLPGRGPGSPGRGARRAPRPARPHGRLDGRVAPQAGLPGRLQPRRSPRRDAQACGPGRTAPRAPWPRPEGQPGRGAARARARAEPLPKRADTSLQGRPRGPAPWRAAPQPRAPLPAGERSPGGRSR
jgi:hypothetical protein